MEITEADKIIKSIKDNAWKEVLRTFNDNQRLPDAESKNHNLIISAVRRGIIPYSKDEIPEAIWNVFTKIIHITTHSNKDDVISFKNMPFERS